MVVLATVAPTEEGARNAATVDNGLSGTGALVGDAIFDFDRLRDDVVSRGDVDDVAGHGRRVSRRDISTRFHCDGGRVRAGGHCDCQKHRNHRVPCFVSNFHDSFPPLSFNRPTTLKTNTKSHICQAFCFKKRAKRHRH